MIRTSACVLAGVLLAQLISFPPATGLLLVTVATFAALAAFRGWCTLLDVGLVLAGCGWFLLSLWLALEAQLDRRYEGDSLLVEVRISDFPEQRASGTRFLAVPLADSRLPDKLSLSWFDPPIELCYGDVWRLELRLRRPRGRMNPGSSDILARHLASGIGATGYVAAGWHNQLVNTAAHGFIGGLRGDLDERISSVVDDPGTAAVLSAIGLGARHRLSAEQRARFAATGTSHLMAISGLHIGLAAIATYALTRLLFAAAGLRRQPHACAVLAGLGVAVLYACLSGFAIPARRATMMLSIAAIMILTRREMSAINVLAITSLAICIADPLATLSAAFRLSFAAVLLLMVAARQLPSAAGHWLLRPYVAGARLVSLQCLLFLGLLPLTALVFARVSIAGPIVNLIAIPLFGFVTVPTTLAGLMLDGVFAPAGNLVLTIAAESVTWLERLIEASAGGPAAVSVPELGGVVWICLFLGLTWLLPPGVPGRGAAWLGATAIVLFRPSGPAPGCARIDVLDVGQGLAVVVQTQYHALLYDTGPSFRGGGSTVRSTVLPFLSSRGIHSLDRIVVSHGDSDHAGGLDDLLEVMPVADILAGDGLDRLPGVASCLLSRSWQWDDVRFDVLYPEAGDVVSGNNGSCVLLVSAAGRRALLTGDIEGETEALLVRRRRLPNVDWATVPHHGSRTSSTSPFVQATKPGTAIVSAGFRNRWGMPTPEVVERWRSVGASVWNTAESGALSATLCTGLDPAPTAYRDSHGRLWHRLAALGWP